MFSVKFFALLALATSVVGQLEIAGVPLHVPTPQFALQAACSATTVATCTGCNQIAACVGGTVDVSISCSALSPLRPYCNTFNGVSSCQATPDIVNGCTPPVEVFTCTSSGYFPSPSKCNQFYICNADGLATPYVCPQPGFIYNPASKMCRFVGTDYTALCAARSFDCVNTDTLFLPFPAPDDDYYVYCKPDAAQSFSNPQALVLRCPDSYRFKDESCQFECTTAGIFPVLNNRNAYIECLAAGDGQPLVMNVVQCPVNMVYDPVLLCKPVV